MIHWINNTSIKYSRSCDSGVKNKLLPSQFVNNTGPNLLTSKLEMTPTN